MCSTGMMSIFTKTKEPKESGGILGFMNQDIKKFGQNH